MATRDQDKVESEETEANVEPAIEIPSTSHQFLPRVHSAIPATTPVFNSYQSVFQYWKDSVPKLYKYPSSEIEVVIYRKNGKIDKFKRSRNEEAIQSNCSRPTDSEEPAGNVTRLMHHLSNFQVTSTFPSAMDIASLPNPGTDVEGLHSLTMLQSSPTSMPHIPTLYDESIDVAIQPVSEPLSMPMRITPISSDITDLFRNNQSLLELNNYKAVPDIEANIGSKKGNNESMPLSETLRSRCDPSIVHRMRPLSNNCKFKFGFKLSNLRLKIDVGATEGINDEVNILTDLSSASIGNEQHVLDTILTASLVDTSTQSDSSVNIMLCEKYVQNVPLLNSASCQTLDDKKDFCDADSQTNVATTNTKLVQTTDVPVAAMSDFNCQVAIFPSLLVQASQTDASAVTNSSSQTHFSSISEETQTIVDKVDVKCQAVVTNSSKNDQTEIEILNPVISVGCQTVVQVQSKSSQSGASSLDPISTNHFASQFSPAVESKDVQLSGSCCYFRERLIRKHFEKKIQMLLEKVNENAETRGIATSTPLPASHRSKKYAEEEITEDVVNSLIHKFNTHVDSRRDQEDELRTEVENLSKVISLARSSIEVEDDFDYYDD